jgi:beta-lactam-binding protein with PASTA domain
MFKNYLWIIPFLSFLFGFQLLNFLCSSPEFTVPSLVGQPISQAVQLLSEHHLIPRIIAEKEEQTLPAGTILSQAPPANHKIKTNQAIFLITSKKPQQLETPLVLKKSLEQLSKELKTLRIQAQLYRLPSTYPSSTCIAQFPEATQPLEKLKMIIYTSTSTTKPVLFPNLKGRLVNDVKQELKNYPSLSLQISHLGSITQHHECRSCYISDQKPLPGSLINVDKPLLIQLQAETL